MTEQKSPQGIQSLQIGLNILDVFLEKARPLKFAEVQEYTGMTKSNLYKYLHTFTQSGVLYRDPVQNTYSLGSRLIEYGNAALGSTDIIGRVLPHLKEISQQTSLTTLLAVWSHDGPVIAHIWNANYGINIGAQIGAKLPLLSSSGKIFAAFMKGTERQEWELRELSKLTELKRKEFITERGEIEKNKFTYASEPLIEHISSFSVPLLDFQQNLLGALTVVGFTPLVPKNTDDEISQYVLEQAQKISSSFGYRP
ncbi:IclR family transcriptional regulator [Domibacillus antri]|uniref:IclR family transcriptional regulator n=1 Tax=Domibacillus antri TaxID=1714264 RepID=A0A1Q8Q3X2_9BACI|nr:IclR family transcriptional regulator [Domibacillus antri]OLN22040.1 IclR family transcriptional regulator [Domibacillus antri]